MAGVYNACMCAYKLEKPLLSSTNKHRSNGFVTSGASNTIKQ